MIQLFSFIYLEKHFLTHSDNENEIESLHRDATYQKSKQGQKGIYNISINKQEKSYCSFI